MSVLRRGALASILSLAAAASVGSVQSQPLKIGFLTDFSGPTSAQSGQSSKVAIEMAIEDFGKTVLGRPVQLLSADHQGKPDVGLSIVREWIDREKVDLIYDANNSAVALAISELARTKGVAFMAHAATTRLSNESCSPYQTQWLMDSIGTANAVVKPLLKSAHDSWFFITVDYAFGHDTEAWATEAVRAGGGQVLGSARHTPSTTDFSSFLINAQSRGAKTIGLATFGAFQVNLVKQAKEFGVTATLAPFYMSETDVRSIGLANLKDVRSATIFYWDRNEKTRAFSKRFETKVGRPPTFTNATHYSGLFHYLKSVAAAGSAEPKIVNAKMRELKIADATDVSAYIRKDGLVVRDVYTYTVKQPSESKSEWDILNIEGIVKGDDIMRPLAEGTCQMTN